MDAIKKLFYNHTLLVSCGLCSLFILFFLIFLHGIEPSILGLETRWLIVSGAPLLYASIVGGYLKSFRGFGVELESQLNTPITNTALFVSDVFTKMPSDEKLSRKHLAYANQKTLKKNKVLIFNCGKNNYYNVEIIEEYLHAMPNLEYFEFVDENGYFKCLLPISIFKPDATNLPVIEPPDNNALFDLVNAINNDHLFQTFGAEVINEKVTESKSVIEILPVVRQSRHGIVGVLNENDKLVGIVDERALESSIADEVLKAQRKK